MTLEEVEKQPGDILDWDADYSAFCNDRSDTGVSATVVITGADSSLVCDSHSLINSTSKHEVADVSSSVCKLFLSGGTHKVVYKVTAALTTAGGRTLEYDFNVKVKEL